MLADIGKIRLEALGYSAEKYTTSSEALERFRDQPKQFDLVITDMTMPKMTGDKLARRIKEIRPEIPVILCSGFNERVAETSAKEIGIKGFMVKPMKLEELARMIRSVLEE